MLRFFHNPLLIAKLAEYDYLIKGNKKQSTAEYKIRVYNIFVDKIKARKIF